MLDNNTAIGRLDALELLIAELLVKAELSQDPPNTDHQIRGRFHDLIIAHARQMQEHGVPQAQISACSHAINRIRDYAIALLKLRSPVSQ